jgi:hypothetical protein
MLTFSHLKQQKEINKMDAKWKVGLGCFGVIVLLVCACLFGTVFLYWCWPCAVTAFPKLVSGGWLVPQLSFSQAFCLSVVSCVLLKSIQSTTKS